MRCRFCKRDKSDKAKNMKPWFSLGKRTLKFQFFIVFCLVCVIPVLALLNYVFPSFFQKETFPLVFLVLLILSFLGLIQAKKSIDSIVSMSVQAKGIASGELTRTLETGRQDEIGDLAIALNQMTGHIKSSMDELKIYGERTKEINSQINRQVLAFSALLQLGELIAGRPELREIADAVVARLSQVLESTLAFMVFKNQETFSLLANRGLKADSLEALKVPANQYLLNALLDSEAFIQLEGVKTLPKFAPVSKIFGVAHLLIFPIQVQGRVHGFLGVGRFEEGAAFGSDDVELVKIFVRQLGIALENDHLIKKIEDLEVIDAQSGLYNKRYLLNRFEEEILRAISMQRPCSFVAVRIPFLREVSSGLKESALNQAIRAVSGALRENLSEIDRIGRMDVDEFGIILPELNKRQAQDVASKIQACAVSLLNEMGQAKGSRVFVSVVENPIDGVEGLELIKKAQEALG